MTRPSRPSFRAATFAAIIALILSSCSGSDVDSSIQLPPTPVLNLRPTWAVITEPYVRLRAEPSDDAAISGHLRYGDVARISAIGTVVARVNGERHYWFELATDAATGWALDTVLEAYNSELRARNASARLEQ